SGMRKFAFDIEFAPDGAILTDAPKRQTPEEIEAECKAAYERGKQDAVAQAERQAAAALETLAGAASAVLTRLDAESRAMREEAAHVALTAARKIAGAALDGFAAARVAAAVEAAMDNLRHQPRLIVKLAPDAAEQLKPRIAEMTEAHGYASAVLVRAQEGLRKGEVVIDWTDGLIASSPQETETRIAALIEAALASPEAP
ncbi:MAG TPA: FliH/SctL family protein, partial [Terricaulis sp.]|nr:FliH/SctL family protein [Terricaulis sp.]